ncbi:cytochrome-c oxidase, cbb3-type subunit III [Ancylobacter amanitiformis]|uniref:Cbb3-type cytochrome c oxidase subunit n=1 Tax=Ancylobacter amanitiformis TaxID=217069 RepID=A0ABU0LTC8_9HYPH|nr:cytochrome-c oxidase, cbb3-type subunit III [Ancylobacter amanitiformis]MDQ0511973.1 cytochrome c oxidase cbb3-type subunit 3 [Ancylobacter amanitiformis]
MAEIPAPDAHKHEVDAVTGVVTTGHEWDGIRELNNPLPRWWLWTFYACILWSVLYWIAYPAWPLVSGYTAGALGWKSRDAVQVQLADLRAQRAVFADKLAAASLEQIESSPELLSFARAQGRAAFGDNCAPCHGAGAAGSKGYPNLNDDDWMWGGSLEQIQQTILHGIRSTDPDAHVGDMLAFGRDGMLQRPDIVAVADYVRSLSNLPAPVEARTDLAKGQGVFEANCAACHGADAKGNQELGAPNLTDGIWLYGSDRASVIATITNGRGGIMPAWAGRLDAGTVKALTVYVHALGGGK